MINCIQERKIDAHTDDVCDPIQWELNAHTAKSHAAACQFVIATKEVS